MIGAMRATIGSVAACLALGFAGCGGDDSSNSGPPPATQPVATSTETTPAAANVVEVDMKDIKYVPASVTAKVGQTVRWTNSDPVAHTVTAKSGSDVDSGTIDPNDTFETKFTKAGKVDYVCAIHPNQTGTVTVR
jgi:plastocyanin